MDRIHKPRPSPAQLLTAERDQAKTQLAAQHVQLVAHCATQASNVQQLGQAWAQLAKIKARLASDEQQLASNKLQLESNKQDRASQAQRIGALEVQVADLLVLLDESGECRKPAARCRWSCIQRSGTFCGLTHQHPLQTKRRQRMRGAGQRRGGCNHGCSWGRCRQRPQQVGLVHCRRCRCLGAPTCVFAVVWGAPS